MNESDKLWRLSLTESLPLMDMVYKPGNTDLFQYETKRAGDLHSLLLGEAQPGSGTLTAVVKESTNNNNNTNGGIRDVQIHKSKFGKETRVETELQSCGPATDLNINIIMDSDSNVSNAVANSLEYESQDLPLPTDETPTPGDSSDLGGESGGGGRGGGRGGGENADDDDGGEGGSGGQSGGGGGGGSGGGGGESDWQQQRDTADKSDESDDDDSKARSGGGGGGGGSGGRSGGGGGDDDEDGYSEANEEEGEGEGDMDDAMKHYKRYLDGEKIDLLRGPSKEDDIKETMKKLPTGHLEKEGVVIGCMSVFADVHIKEFLVMLSDDMIQAFLIDPERFRSVANRTKCEIEVTRRILNRRMGKYRWLKYLVVIIRGPSFSTIDQCDKMMTMLFPPYRWRKPYGTPAAVSMYLKESTPDNTDLYFNYQRTGPCQKMFGEIPLRAPFRKTKARPVEQTPWKMVQKRQQWGVLEPKNDRMERVMSHVYPERGGSLVGVMDHDVKWADAAAQAVEMSKAKDLARSQLLNVRKMESEPLYAHVVGE